MSFFTQFGPFQCSEGGNTWIYIENFVKFLKCKHTERDSVKTVRQFNVEKELSGYKGETVITINDKQAASVCAILRYIFNHCESYECCKILATDIERCLFKNNSSTAYNRTILQLYDALAKNPIKDKLIDQHLSTLYTIEDSSIPSLFRDYKTKYTEAEWKRICLFESYFSIIVPTQTQGYEESVQKRWDVYESLLSMKKVGEEFEKVASHVIQSRIQRKQAAEVDLNIELYAELRHLPTILDARLEEHLALLFPEHFGHVVCVSLKASQETNKILVIVEQDSESFSPPHTEASDRVKRILANEHSVLCESVIFLQKGTFELYTKNGFTSRFTLRDDLQLGNLSDRVLHVSSPGGVDVPFESTNEEDNKCKTCFSTSLPKPLRVLDFDVLQEWHLDVPLGFQIILETFINKNSLKKSVDKQDFLKKKINRVYSIHDVLLNTYNKRHIGVLQEANTEELLMEYHSIGSVFSVTGASGMTTSLKAAELKLEEKATNDQCYFNTYIKKHLLEYETSAGMVQANISLQECHLILMLDNLVRLKFRNDPHPGESRSGQICTLPITLQGLPKDAKLCEEWHDVDSCDGSATCSCKSPKQLVKNDFEPTLLLLSPEEQCEHMQFKRLCTWGLSVIWRNHKIFSKELLAEIMKTKLRPYICPQTNDEQSCIQPVDLNNDLVHSDQSRSSTPLVDFQEGIPEDIVTFPDTGSTHEDLAHDYMPDDLTEASRNLHSREEATCSGTPSFAITSTGNPGSTQIMNEATGESNRDFTEGMAYFNYDTSVDVLTEPIEQYSDELEEESLHQILHDARMVVEPTWMLYDHIDVSEIIDERDFAIPLEDTWEDDINCAVMEESFQNLSLTGNFDSIPDEAVYEDGCTTPEQFGFHKFKPPTLLCRHPPPAMGRDDDIQKLREILDDVLTKMELNKGQSSDRILCGPDNKIGINLLKLVEHGRQYGLFLPEFPLLHLRKSKINTLFSAYKGAGLLHILQYMRDETSQEWSKLVSAEHIDVATRNVRRLSIAFHVAFFICFIDSLPDAEVPLLWHDVQSQNQNQTCQAWDEKYQMFLDLGKKSNATFALHCDMMQHCDEVLAVALAERLGGKQGYHLLLAAVKSSLTFAFLNGASSYAPYCTKLIHTHYSAGTFHQNMKYTLFSTPIGTSTVNFACDTKREMDHQAALKGFRSGSTAKSVTCRMSLIDPLNAVHQKLSQCDEDQDSDQKDLLGWTVQTTDFMHIWPAASLILRQGGLSIEQCDTPFNVYTKQWTPLSTSILDQATKEVGHYLVKKYVIKDGLFGYIPSDTLDSKIPGPKPLVQRALKSKGVTLKRSSIKVTEIPQNLQQAREAQRQRDLKREAKQANCLSSHMNMCQAIVKPDCTKAKVQKSTSMQKALVNIMGYFSTLKPDMAFSRDTAVQLNVNAIPKDLAESVTLATVEFAGVKFKSAVKSGDQYMKYVEGSVIKGTLLQFPAIKKLVVCEEKYSFTPDSLKAATREQRKSRDSAITTFHLKTSDDIVSSAAFNKKAIIETAKGKSLISTYLAANISQLQLKTNLTLVLDSELHLKGCVCQEASASCRCNLYTVPLECQFTKRSGLETTTPMETIQQRKGEAEMAQVDWTVSMATELGEGEAVLSIVTSGDIDAVPIHMFVLSQYWPRNPDGTFTHACYVLLQKPHKRVDLYNITYILEVMEKATDDKHIGVKIAMGLCLGGNDFIPKFHGISHEKVLKTLLQQNNFCTRLFTITPETGLPYKVNVKLQPDVFVELVKVLYCPKTMDSSLPFETIRKATMFTSTVSSTASSSSLAHATLGLRNAQLWMPPESAIRVLADLVQLFVDYLSTAGVPDATLPDFLKCGCLRKNESGQVEYDFGKERHASLAEILKNKPTEISSKRKMGATPQKGRRKKKQVTSTPQKEKE